MIRFKYTELAAWLREQILSENYKIGERIPTEYELASIFSVSRDTVRKAIEVLEKESLLNSVKGSGTYVCAPQIKGNQPAPIDTKRIGILMNDIDSYIFPAIVKGINTALNQYGYSSIIQITNNNISQERSALEVFLNGGFSGLIIEPTKSALPQVNYDLYQKICRSIPAVIIHAKLPTLSFSSITIGDEQGAFKVTDYLLKNGHEKIAVFLKFDEQTGTNRYLGFAKAYQKAGIPIPDRNIFWFSSEHPDELFREPVDSHIAHALSECSAVICHDDRLALLLKKYLENKNSGKTITICGFDDSAIAEEYGFISIVHPKEKFGEYAAMRLLEKIKEPAAEVSFDFNPQLVIHHPVHHMHKTL